MADSPDVFERNYREYCARIAEVDLRSIQSTLGLVFDGERASLPFFNRRYLLSKDGMVNEEGNRPDYMVSVILAKYILLCPDHLHQDPEWVAFKDLNGVSPLVNYFSSDAEGVIEKTFAGRVYELTEAGRAFGGVHDPPAFACDVSMRFSALPRIALLVLFQDRDDEFPAKCTILFQRQAGFYLDPESLAMTAAFLAKGLKRHCDQGSRASNG